MLHNPDQTFVMKTIENRDVHFIRFWFTDVLGQMKALAVIPDEMDNALVEGLGFDGSAIEGFRLTENSDLILFPEASTFQVLPWRPERNAVGRMFCNVALPDGSPFHGDPRLVLKKMVAKAANMGYAFAFSPEIEYYYFKSLDDMTPLDCGSSFDLTSMDSGTDLRRDTVLTLERMGIPVQYSHHEHGPSQNEIDLRYADPLSTADAVMTYKLVVKEIAAQHGVYASFMPKPFTEHPGNGMHINQMIYGEDGENAFYDENDPQGYGLSQTGKHYLAGLLKYAPEYCLLTNQYVNSYKRLMEGYTAPCYMSWGRTNRTTLVRVPLCRKGHEDNFRMELRCPDSAANPYLAIAAIMAAGLKGIEEKLELEDPVETHNLNNIPRYELRERGIRTLPESLGEAVETFARSELMRETLGDHIHKFLVDTKRREWEEYKHAVSNWERDRFYSVL